MKSIKKSSSKIRKNTGAHSKDDVLAAPTLDVLIQLQDFAQRFGFDGVLTPADRSKSSHFRVDPRFVEAAASAVESFTSVLGGDFDAASLRVDLATLAGLASVASAARTLARSIGDAILIRRTAIAHTSDAIFAAVKAKSMTPNGKALTAVATEMAALRKRGPLPKKQKAAEPAPVVQQVQQARVA